MTISNERMVILPLGTIGQIDSIILALDPGGTTGYAYYEPWSGKVVCGELGPGGHHAKLMDLITDLSHRIHHDQPENGHQGEPRYWPLTIVYEQFEFRQNEEAVRAALRKYIVKLKGGSIKSLRSIVGALEDIVEIWPGRDKLVLTSREYIGVVKLAVQEHTHITLASQSASEAKSFVSPRNGDKKLVALGWHAPTRGKPHARDALRHLLKYLVSSCNVGAPITTAWLRRIWE